MHCRTVQNKSNILTENIEIPVFHTTLYDLIFKIISWGSFYRYIHLRMSLFVDFIYGGITISPMLVKIINFGVLSVFGMVKK